MKYLSKFIALTLALLTILRIIFLLIHSPGNEFNLFSIIIALIHGARYDLSSLSYLIFPILLLYIYKSVPSTKLKNISLERFINNYLIVIILTLIIISIIDIGFYYEFNTRINYLAIEYLLFFESTLLTIIKVFPYNFLFILIVILSFIIIIMLQKCIHFPSIIRFQKYSTWLIYSIIYLFILTICIRGGVQNKPLNWSNANITQFRFTNQLILNPLWNLGNTIQTSLSENSNNMLDKINLSLEESNLIANKSLQSSSALYLSKEYPALRKTTSNKPQNKYNVVIVLMESFAGTYIGKLGNNDNISPYFDNLTNDGIFFTRMFSCGTRTNRGLSGTLLSFPALPRFKSILLDASVDQYFSSLANILNQRDYNSYYLFGGDLGYDNQYGFFTGQGFNHFIGENDFDNNVFSTVWGVADEFIFDKAIQILKSATSPLLISILTMSNHPTYEFPTPKEFIPVSSELKNHKRLNAFKYSDWALGNFMEKCEKEGLHNNTIFVILGDHGITSGPNHQNSSLDISSYYIPCLIIAPKLTPDINNRVSSQIDIIPTVLDLLGGSFIHNSWGKNLLGNSEYLDFAIISPSGLNHIMGIITDKHFYIYNFTDNDLNELYSITYSINTFKLNKISNNFIQSKLENNMLGFTKSAYNALISYKCGISP